MDGSIPDWFTLVIYSTLAFTGYLEVHVVWHMWPCWPFSLHFGMGEVSSLVCQAAAVTFWRWYDSVENWAMVWWKYQILIQTKSFTNFAQVSKSHVKLSWIHQGVGVVFHRCGMVVLARVLINNSKWSIQHWFDKLSSNFLFFYFTGENRTKVGINGNQRWFLVLDAVRSEQLIFKLSLRFNQDIKRFKNLRVIFLRFQIHRSLYHFFT